MRTPRWLLLNALLWASAVGAQSSPTVLQVQLPAPGYIKIDGRYYLYDRSANGSTGPESIYVHARQDKSFFLHGFVTAAQCRSNRPIPLDARTLYIGETLNTAEAQIPLYSEGIARNARIYWLFCPTQGIGILGVATAPGDVTCNNPVPAPFTEAQCPGISNLLPDRFHIFGAGFED